MIFGIKIEEFIALIGAVIAIIATLKKLDTRDPILDRSVDAVEEIIQLLERQIKELTSDVTKHRKRNRNFREKVVKFLSGLIQAMKNFVDDIE
ncbi:MAG: hypothetical protein JRE40_00060 [Deltaproteobacteria bacterium]|nr:hypothetical protein [Deltaproteobacteria bacterium]